MKSYKITWNEVLWEILARHIFGGGNVEWKDISNTRTNHQ